MRLTDLEGKRVALWGAGREASATLRAIKRNGIACEVAVYDELADVETELEGARVLVGDNGVAAVQAADVLVLSPGVSRYRDEVVAEQDRGASMTSATDLFFGEGFTQVIAVTGTKGKSTTSSIIAHLLNELGSTAQLAGNIGRSPIDFVGDITPDWWVLELSSFQSASVHNSPNIGVFTTLSPEHLDWHGGFEQYRDDKLNLFINNPDIVTVANVADAGVAAVTNRLTNVIEAGEDAARYPDAVTSDGEFFVYHGARLFPLSALRLLGRHNVRLTCLALTAIAQTGIDLITRADEVSAALFTFEPLPHRLAPVAEMHDILYVDDGLATTPIATMAAIDAFEGRPVTLLAGGHDRGISYDFLGQFLADREWVTTVTMPANGTRIAGAISEAGGQDAIVANSLEEAVEIAAGRTPAGGVVLLSPAAASFGAFRDYVERSEAFVRYVSAL